MSESLFILEPYSPIKRNKYTCPRCGKKNRFRRYINSNTGQQIADDVGWCDRINSCKYHKKPWEVNGLIYSNQVTNFTRPKAKPEKPRKYASKSKYMEMLVKDFDHNRFYNFLIKEYGSKAADEVVKAYYLGTGSDRKSCLFPYFDMNYNLICYKKIYYQFLNGKRDKSPGKLPCLDSNIYRYPIPLFGLWLAYESPRKSVMIHESEKSGVIATLHDQSINHLATGGRGWLNVKKLEPIKDKNIVLMPDVGEYNTWLKIAIAAKKEYPRIRISVSDKLELLHKEGKLNAGDDLADYHLQQHTKEKSF